MLCADVVLFKLVRKLHNFDLIVLDLSGFSFSGYRLVVFFFVVQLFLNHFSDYLLSDPVDKQRHLAGNFRDVSGRLCWIFKFCLRFFSWYLLVSSFSVTFCRAILFLRTGRNLLCEYFFLNIYPCFSYIFFFLCLVDL